MVQFYVMDIDLNKVEILPVEKPTVAKQTEKVEQESSEDTLGTILLIAGFTLVIVILTSLMGGAINNKTENISKTIEQGNSTSVQHTDEFSPAK